MKDLIRKYIKENGADVCGFVNVRDLKDVPGGFSPRDIWSDCNTVIVFGIALPRGLFNIPPKLIYGFFNYGSCPTVDALSLKSASYIERNYNADALPLPSDGPYDYWEKENLHGHGIVSLKHLAVGAGIGTLGKNTILLNKDYGNRLTLGALLTTLDLESDEPAKPLCIEDCTLCLDNCPVGALDGNTATQKSCRLNCYGKNDRGFDTLTCNKCRMICPFNKI